MADLLDTIFLSAAASLVIESPISPRSVVFGSAGYLTWPPSPYTWRGVFYFVRLAPFLVRAAS
jgi:hypothetical protein